MTRLIAVLFACLGLAVSVRADEGKIDGFKPLFNGKDLTGWVYKNEKLDGKTATSDKRFYVKDGAIVTDGGSGNLYTAESFDSSFHLILEFRAAPRADSGVFVRGPQLQVRDFIRRKEHMQLEKVFKNDDWNQLDIAVGPPAISTVVNGKTLAKDDALELGVKDGKVSAKLNGKEVDVATLQIGKAASTVCKVNGIAFDPGYKAGPKGPIGLQAETGKFEFRGVRVKEMK